MNRKVFLKKTAVTALGSLVVPYILPTGRLFAATGTKRVNHVVFCLFAGGVRQLESVYMEQGNLMPLSLNGNLSIQSLLNSGIDPLSAFTQTPIQQHGTLFKEFRYNEGPTAHYNAHVTAITGHYFTKPTALGKPPEVPTIFELYRKHTSPNTGALGAWWISDAYSYYPFLSHSSHPDYGSRFAANSIQPESFFSQKSRTAFSFLTNKAGSKYQIADALSNALYNSKNEQEQALLRQCLNSPTEQLALDAFIQSTFKAYKPDTAFWSLDTTVINKDIRNIYLGTKLLSALQPELTVINMQEIDDGHTDYTSYINNIHKADFALAQLWHTIQTTPGLANETVLIAAPEHGRNAAGNGIADAFGRIAIDHTGDEMSRRIFCLIVGPSDVIKQNKTVNDITGESIDIAPTIAHLLGFKHEIPAGLLRGRVLQEALA